ncbi:MAG: dienelactone hydrolase family protein [Casimicrobiaceae bacterium]
MRVASIRQTAATGRKVDLAMTDVQSRGLLVQPDAAVSGRAVIVLHEWWGLNDWIVQRANALAASGYVVFAADLYRGAATNDPVEARRLKRDLPQGRAIDDMTAAFEQLSARPDVDPTQIRAVGWSLGGGLALQLAIHEPRLAGCVVNYGALPMRAAELASIDAPVLGNFGVLDRSIPVARVRAFEAAMRDLGKSVDIKLYEGAGHAFENPDNKRGYRPEAAADASLRTLDFLAREARRASPWSAGSAAPSLPTRCRR